VPKLVAYRTLGVDASLVEQNRVAPPWNKMTRLQITYVEALAARNTDAGKWDVARLYTIPYADKSLELLPRLCLCRVAKLFRHLLLPLLDYQLIYCLDDFVDFSQKRAKICL